MNKNIFVPAALASCALAASAQTTATGFANGLFQFNTVSTAQGAVTVKFESMARKTVVGKPVAATEERHTLQILGDGTRIENTDTDKFYRDDQGRTRIERQDGTVLVSDPVAGVTAEVNSSHRVIRRDKLQERGEFNAALDKLKAEAVAVQAGRLQKELPTQADKQRAEAASKEASREEDLGYQSVNGVTAQGFRTTTTIPVGQVGNDRPIQIVSERWYSPDLQMNVKTTNSDPRFGETTYQVTNIVQSAPDPTLFEVPAGRIGDTVQQ